MVVERTQAKSQERAEAAEDRFETRFNYERKGSTHLADVVVIDNRRGKRAGTYSLYLDARGDDTDDNPVQLTADGPMRLWNRSREVWMKLVEGAGRVVSEKSERIGQEIYHKLSSPIQQAKERGMSVNMARIEGLGYSPSSETDNLERMYDGAPVSIIEMAINGDKIEKYDNRAESLDSSISNNNIYGYSSRTD